LVEISNSLKEFHMKHCPNVPQDSPIVIVKLLEEIVKIKNKKRKN
jgi:hypothetical protein